MVFTVNYELKIFSSIEELAETFANILFTEVSASKDNFNLALSGGTTPKFIFNFLADNYQTKINLNKINFFWGDERCIPPTNDESNYKMAFDNLLSKINIPGINIFRIKGEVDPEIEAKNYSKIIHNNLPPQNHLPVFDMIMLGLGEDGHTASIFPNQMYLLNDRNICSVAVHPKTKQKRITLTGRIINNSRNIVFIVTGSSKSKIVYDILNGSINSKNYPAAFIQPASGKLTWLIDKEAASLLKGNKNWKTIE